MTSRKHYSFGVVAGLLALAVLACQSGDILPEATGQLGATPAATTAPPAATAPAAATTTSGGAAGPDWYQLYFVDPNAYTNNATGGVPDQIAASFDSAQHTIDVAVYQFDLMPLAQSLLRAKARGVTVRVVTDSDSLNMDGIAALSSAGVPVVPDKRDPIMHDKFAVVDGATVWTGSMNYTVSDAYHNDNNVIVIHSTELAQNYTHEFEKMFVTKKFTKHTKPPDTPYPAVTIDGTEIDTYFSPGGGVAEHINDVLAAAQKSIYFLAFSFTRKDFGQTLLDEAAAGRDVRGVFESEELSAGGTQVWNMLTNGGLSADIRKDGNTKNMHDKVFVVDQSIVVTGSYNFSASAEDDNDENALIIHDPTIGAAYYGQWQRVWAEGK